MLATPQVKRCPVFALLAQLVRASVLHTEGRRFESYREHSPHKVWRNWPEIYSCKLDAESRAAHLRDGLYGGCSSIGRALVCGTKGSGIETHHSPKWKIVRVVYRISLLKRWSRKRPRGSNPLSSAKKLINI
jgi:hypothetical protein